MHHIKATPLAALILKAAIVFAPAFALTAQAASQTYAVTFASATGDNGTGSFVWDDTTLKMTNFNWTFAGGSGSFSDAGLAATIYSPGSARSVGALFFNLFTDPVAYWPSTNGLLSSSSGYFNTSFISSGPVSGTYPPDMLSINYAKGATTATYEFLDLTPTRLVLNSGTITAAPVPEPESYAMLLAGLGLMAVLRRRVQDQPSK
jgi:hypothetical protein